MDYLTNTGALRLRTLLLTLAGALALALPAGAQTITLTDASDTTLRGGSYANTNFGRDTVLTTRDGSTDLTYERRILLKFDTHNTIAASSPVASATLTLTVKGGNSLPRTLDAFRITQPYTDTEANWNIRRVGLSWSTAGGAIAEKVGSAPVTNVAGSKVTFDVTSMVRNIVNGTYGSSRYARFLIQDNGGSTKDSYKEYYSEEAGNGPVLKVVLGSTSTTNPAPAPTGTRLKVLEYNIHHGVGTDGVYDINRIATLIANQSPDVVAIIEAEKYTSWGNEDQPRRFRDLLQSKTGQTWYYHFAQEFGAWDSNGKGNLLLSRYPFVSTDRHLLSWDRTIATGAITVNGRNVSILVTHLDPDYPSRRYTQANQVKTYASGIAENRIITGDWNAWPDQSSVTTMSGSYYDAWVEAEKIGAATYYSSYSAGQTKKGRIDYFFYSKGASNLKIVKMQLIDSRDANGVMPSDHRPIMVTFEVR
ncbi:MAG TPA: DNRLRE domain-containing protein [Vicinamibacterales bacterium]|nr:DNRLRE domain-containing protein [Vicinamibacterales bacterium]